MMPSKDDYYFTSVWDFGIPIYLRYITLAEAQQLWDKHREMPGCSYCQYGLHGAPKPLGSWANIGGTT
jgi:hypothetical protein